MFTKKMIKGHREYLMEIRINNSYNVKKKQEILNTLWGRKDEKFKLFIKYWNGTKIFG